MRTTEKLQPSMQGQKTRCQKPSLASLRYSGSYGYAVYKCELHLEVPVMLFWQTTIHGYLLLPPKADTQWRVKSTHSGSALDDAIFKGKELLINRTFVQSAKKRRGKGREEKNHGTLPTLEANDDGSWPAFQSAPTIFPQHLQQTTEQEKCKKRSFEGFLQSPLMRDSRVEGSRGGTRRRIHMV